MAGASGIRMGKAFVEIGGDDSPLRKLLRNVEGTMKSWGTGLMAIGGGMLGTGLAMAGALVPAITQFATFEQSLADLRAAANATPEQMDRVRASIEALAKATGTDPNEVADGFRQLLFAGVALETVLGGAGQTLIQFARVGLMPAGEAAIFLTDAVNVFGVSFQQAADIMTQGASASSISIKDMADSFGQAAAGMRATNQTMADTAVALAIMGNAGVKGAQAGTALKTFMTRIVTGAAEAGESADEVSKSMSALGLEVVDASGKILPMVEILRRINVGLEGKSDVEKMAIVKGLAGMRGMIGLLPLLQAGVTGFDAMAASMAGSLTVEQRFAIMSDTLMTAMKRAWVHVQFVAIAIGEALAPALRGAGATLLPFLDMLQSFIQTNQELVQAFAFDAVKAIAFGAALFGLGAIIYGVAAVVGFISTVLGILGAAFGFVFSPVGAVLIAVAAAAYLLWANFDSIKQVVINLWTTFASSPLAGFLATLLKVWIGFAAVMAVVYVLIGYLVYLAASEWFAGLIAGARILLGWLGKVADLWLQTMEWLMSLDAFQALAGIATHLQAVFSAAFSKTADLFSELFGKIVGTAMSAWDSIKQAFMAGDWETIFGTVKFSAMLMWNDLTFFIRSTVNVWKDTLLDVFSGAWFAIELGFISMWGSVKESSFKALSDIATGIIDLGGGALNIIAPGVLAPLRLARTQLDSLRDSSATATEASVSAATRADTQLRGQNRQLRAARDLALSQGRDAEAARLNAELDAVAEIAWWRQNAAPADLAWAQDLIEERNLYADSGMSDLASNLQDWLDVRRGEIEELAIPMEMGGLAQRPLFPDGGGALLAGGAFGSFSGSQLSYGVASPLERSANAAERIRDLAQEQRDLAAEQRDLLAQLVEQDGAVAQ